MPDLNLQDEGSLDNVEGSEEHAADSTTPEDEQAKKGGGGMMILVIVLAVLIVGGGGAFLLNKLGVIHIFGKQKPAPAVVQLQDQQPAQQGETASQTTDAGQAKMIDTPPVDEKGKAEKKPSEKVTTKSTPKEKAQAPAKEMPAPAQSAKLQEMKGEYTIQVSAWRDKEVAQEIVKRLEDAGYPAFAEDRAYKDGTWYTVRVGRYASRKDAELAVQSFAEELKSNYWIDRAKAK
jgi:cell division septation protein DedD